MLRPAALLLVLVSLTPSPGCDGGDEAGGTRELAPPRVREAIGKPLRWNATPAERYRLSAEDFAGISAATAGDAGAEVEADAAGDGAGGAPRLHWTTPPGWSELPPAPFRDANFSVAGDTRVECYLSVLPGDAGGLETNINRWRKQLELPPLEAAQIAALPRIAWLGGQAVAVDLSGRWTGMAGEQDEQGWRLVGRLLIGDEASYFLKLTGPGDVVAEQLGAFDALAESLHSGEGHAHEPRGSEEG